MFHLVLRRWLLIVGLGLLAAPLARAAEGPVAEWRIDTQINPTDLPTSQLDLVINGRQVVSIQPRGALGDYRLIVRGDFGRFKIPAAALCACQSHVVNTGIYYYAVAVGKDRLALYRQLEDVDGLTGFKKIRTIKVEAH